MKALSLPTVAITLLGLSLCAGAQTASPDPVGFITLLFFFKQKTAYEIRPRDWSSDVCSSDLVAQPSIKKPEDLRGKIGGNHIAGTTAEFALKVGLKKIGIDPFKDVNLRVIGGSIERMVALQKHIVDFTVVTEAGKAMAEKLGYPTVVDMVALKIPFPQNGIFTSTKLIRDNPDFVRRYMRAYVEAIHFFKTHKEETMKVMRKYSRVE